ncbi:MAG: hypothetical protein M1829_002548 [Trizodia sp. TS-e1964]|nr:MAG: hypothetical protein M1829_002548 [Trizodia sp. TS-e1964]
MRIRLPFAGSFFFLLLVFGYLGLSKIHTELVNDKFLHFVTFLVLTTCFYWILDTSRRRNLNISLAVCTGFLGVGSELLQALLPNERIFDSFDIVANVAGSLCAIGICSWYHKGMLERKRRAKRYQIVPGVDAGEDLELGEGTGPHEADPTPIGATLEAEVDNWDEAVDDAWEDDEGPTGTEESGGGSKTPPSTGSTIDDGDGKRRQN